MGCHMYSSPIGGSGGVVELKSDWLWLIGALIAQCSGLCDHSLQYGQQRTIKPSS